MQFRSRRNNMREPGERRGGLIVLLCIFSFPPFLIFIFIFIFIFFFFFFHFCILRMALVSLTIGRSRSNVRENATYVSPLGSSMCSIRCVVSQSVTIDTNENARTNCQRARVSQGEQRHAQFLFSEKPFLRRFCC